MNGKGIYIWKARNCAGGSLAAIVQACKLMDLDWVAIKIGDAASDYFRSFTDMAAAVAAFRAAGIKVWGWHYIYGGVHFRKDGTFYVSGATPAEEAQYAVQQVQKLGLDGYIIDAEREYKVYKQGERASQFMAGLVGIGVPMGLSSYRFPNYHKELPWSAFLAGCQVHMPQVYWGPGNAVRDLDISIQDLSALKVLPVVPVGRLYVGDGYAWPGPGVSEIKAFMSRAVERSCPGAFFWALDFLYLDTHGSAALRAERAKTITDFNWGHGTTPPEAEYPETIGYAEVTANVLNVRSGPGIEFDDMGDLNKLSQWYVFRKSGDWVEIGLDTWIRTGPGLADLHMRGK